MHRPVSGDAPPLLGGPTERTELRTRPLGQLDMNSTAGNSIIRQ
jgi:hypothetical protein